VESAGHFIGTESIMTNGSRWVRIGGDLVNLDAVAGAHQEGPTLYVYLNGGRFLAFKDEDASRMWNVLREESAEAPEEVAVRAGAAA
jgi:hypothetical protein